MDLSHTELRTLPPTPCPVCGKVMDSANGARTPGEGDFSVCLYCASVLRFNADMSLRIAQEQEIKESGLESDLKIIQEVILHVMKEPRTLA